MTKGSIDQEALTINVYVFGNSFKMHEANMPRIKGEKRQIHNHSWRF